MTKILIVGAGGFLGSAMRYLVSGYAQRMFPFASIPYGTLTVNVLGCFMIGLLGGLAMFRNVLSPEIRLFLMVGFLGGFTTFSSFGYETFLLARDHESFKSFLNIAFQLVFGLTGVWLGLSVSKIW